MPVATSTNRRNARRNPSLPLTPISNTRIYEEISKQIENAIYSRKLLPGDKLPSERELAERFHTSRVSVREALRALEHSGLVVIKRGARGGAFIAEAQSAAVTASLSMMLRLGATSIHHLTEARVLLEPDLARMAARRATKEDIKNLGALIAAQERALETHGPHHYDLQFHRLVAAASKNPVLTLVMGSVADLIVEAISSLRLTLDVRRHVSVFHRQVFLAIKERDEEKAHDLMFRHVVHVQRQLGEALRKQATRGKR